MAGLQIKTELDKRTYETGIKVSKEALEALEIRLHDLHVEWNYTISPINTLQTA